MTQAFDRLAAVVSAGMDFPDLPRIVFPHPFNNQPEEFIRDAVNEVMPRIVGYLTSGRGESDLMGSGR